MKHLDEGVEKLEQKLEIIAASNEACRLLLTIPGIGLLSATALFASIDDISAFKKWSGTCRLAWLGTQTAIYLWSAHLTGHQQTG